MDAFETSPRLAITAPQKRCGKTTLLSLGSGRSSGRGTVEACRSVDVNRLHRANYLVPGWFGGWQWTQDGKLVASITLRAEAERIVLSYRCRVGGGEWEDVQEPVPIVRVPCRFGSSRPYLLCPGVVDGITCGRRVVKLYQRGRYFLCRHCYRLDYASQREVLALPKTWLEGSIQE